MEETSTQNGNGVYPPSNMATTTHKFNVCVQPTYPVK